MRKGLLGLIVVVLGALSLGGAGSAVSFTTAAPQALEGTANGDSGSWSDLVQFQITADPAANGACNFYDPNPNTTDTVTWKLRLWLRAPDGTTTETDPDTTSLVCDGQDHTYTESFTSIGAGPAEAAGCLTKEDFGGDTTWCTGRDQCYLPYLECAPTAWDNITLTDITPVRQGRPSSLDTATSTRDARIVLGWSLPSGTQSVHVGVSTSATVAADGSFTGQTVVSQSVASSTTSFVSAQLPKGVYYAHVYSYDPNCDCDVWSNILKVRVHAHGNRWSDTVRIPIEPAA